VLNDHYFSFQSLAVLLLGGDARLANNVLIFAQVPVGNFAQVCFRKFGHRGRYGF
jgi:hypothetical protein